MDGRALGTVSHTGGVPGMSLQKRYVPWEEMPVLGCTMRNRSDIRPEKTPVGSYHGDDRNRYYGHVALVEKVNGDTITVSEMNYVRWGKRVGGLFRLRVEQSKVSSIDFWYMVHFSSVSEGTSGLYGYRRFFFRFFGYTADRIVYGKKQKIFIFSGRYFLCAVFWLVPHLVLLLMLLRRKRRAVFWVYVSGDSVRYIMAFV